MFSGHIQVVSPPDEQVTIAEHQIPLRLDNGTIVGIPKSVVPLLQKWNELRECSLCRQAYVERANFQLACHYHPGQVKGRKYTCCQQWESSSGCRRCDHNPKLAWSTNLDDESGACCLAQIPECLQDVVVGGIAVVVARVTSYEQEEKLKLTNLIGPYSDELKPVAPGSVASWMRLNDALRYEDGKPDYYTDVTKQFNSYLIVQRYY